MGRDENRFSFIAQIVKQIPNLLPMDRIKPRSGFVQEEQRWVVNQSAAEREQLPHSTRQTASQSVTFFFQVSQGEQTVDPLRQFRGRNAAGPAEELEIFLDCEIGIKAEPLRHVTEFFSDMVPIPPNIMSSNQRIPTSGVSQPARACEWSSSCRLHWRRENQRWCPDR